MCVGGPLFKGECLSDVKSPVKDAFKITIEEQPNADPESVCKDSYWAWDMIAAIAASVGPDFALLT